MPEWDDDEADLDLNQATTEEIAAAETDLKEIANEAKANFSFKDKLAGIGGRRDKVMIFTEAGPVAEYNKVSLATRALAAMVAESQERAMADGATDDDRETAERLLASHNASDELLEEKRAEMLQSAWAFHLRSVPNIAVKIARREARKAVKGKEWADPEEQAEVQLAIFRRYLLRDSIEKVAFAQEGELHPTLDDLKEMEDQLDTTQWDRLIEHMNLLIFQDTIANASTDDPGF